MDHGYAFGTCEVHVTARKLLRDGTPIPLPSRAFDTLVYLLRHRNQIVEKDALIAAVWQGSFVSDDSLVHCISVLRRALQDEAERPLLIATVPRRGYRFIGEVVDLAPDAPAPLPQDVLIPHAVREDDVVATNPARSEVIVLSPPTIRAWRMAAIALTAAGIVVISLLLAGRLGGHEGTGVSPPTVVLAQLPPSGATLSSNGVLSPNGRFLAFTARDRDTGTSNLWVRTLDSTDVRVIDTTDGASRPFWSPDSRAIGYFAADRVKTVPIDGGGSRVVARITGSAAGGTWSRDNLLLFGDSGRGLVAVELSTGTTRVVTSLDVTHDGAHAWPSFLPDGRRFLYTITSWNPGRAGIWLSATDGSESPRRLVSSQSPAAFAEPGYLLYVQDNALVALRLAENLSPSGPSYTLASHIPTPRVVDADAFSVSGSLLSYRLGGKSDEMAWFSRQGQRVATLQEPTALKNPTLSPDGSQLLATGIPSRDPGLWLVDLSGNAATRLADDGIGPVWAPDGQRIAYTARGGRDIVLSSTLGPSREQVLLHDDTRKVLQAWSPDGAFLLFTRRSEETQLDLWLLPVAQPEQARPLLATPANERGAAIAPDGRWFAYTSDESGESEVYIQAFPGLGSKRMVSVGGGSGATWRRDEQELFFLSPDADLMALDVRFDSAPHVGRARRLFRPPVLAGVSEARNHYVASPDGKAFLFNITEDGQERAAISVMVNWAAKLRGDPDGSSPSTARLGLVASAAR